MDGDEEEDGDLLFHKLFYDQVIQKTFFRRSNMIRIAEMF